MSKYLEYFGGAFDSTVAEKMKPENKPYVGYSVEEGKVIYSVNPKYLCLEPLEENNQLALIKIGDYSNIQYSFDKSNWNDFTTDPTNPLNPIFISVDKPIYLRGNNPNGILNQELLVGCKLVSNGKYNVSGDATTLLNEKGDVKDLTPYGEQTLTGLFGSIPSESSGLPIDVPCVDIVDASKLILPATTLTDYCYHSMFDGCTSLVVAPKILPATELAERCYYYMFGDCTSLTTAPELPATTLAKHCYDGMFSGCTSLSTAPELPATTLAGGCYDRMFEGCTSLVTAPVLPATELAADCYSYMFYNCISLTTAPELPATELAEGCYYEMFYGCTNLNYIKCLATDITAISCTHYWIDEVANTGIFIKHPDMNDWTTSWDGIPSGWTVVDAEL